MTWFAALLPDAGELARATIALRARRRWQYAPDPVLAAAAARHRLPPATGFAAALIAEADEAPPVEGWIYRVEPREILPGRAGDRVRVALVSPVFRAPGLDQGAFLRHWSEEHAPLALRHHVGMCRYRQLAVLEAAGGGGAPPFDGIAVLGFPDAAAFERGLYDSPGGRRAIAADTARFVDVARLEVALLAVQPLDGDEP